MFTLNRDLRNNQGLLSTSQRGWLLTTLFLHCDHHLQCYPSDELLAEELGVSRPTVKKAREWLIDHGALVKIPYEKRDPSIKKRLVHNKIVYQLTGVLILKDTIIRTLHFFSSEAVERHIGQLHQLDFFETDFACGSDVGKFLSDHMGEFLDPNHCRCKLSLHSRCKLSLHEVNQLEVNQKDYLKSLPSGDGAPGKADSKKSVKKQTVDTSSNGFQKNKVTPELKDYLAKEFFQYDANKVTVQNWKLITMVCKQILNVHDVNETICTTRHLNAFLEWYHEKYPDRDLPLRKGMENSYQEFYDSKKKQAQAQSLSDNPKLEDWEREYVERQRQQQTG